MIKKIEKRLWNLKTEVTGMTKELLFHKRGKIKIVGKKIGLGTEKMVLGKSLRYYDFRFFFRSSVKIRTIIWEKQLRRVTQNCHVTI